MKIRLYFDEDSMRDALVRALRARGVDVATALDAGMIDRDDNDHLDYATAHGYALFSFNVKDYYDLHNEPTECRHTSCRHHIGTPAGIPGRRIDASLATLDCCNTSRGNERPR